MKLPDTKLMMTLYVYFDKKKTHLYHPSPELSSHQPQIMGMVPAWDVFAGILVRSGRLWPQLT